MNDHSERPQPQPRLEEYAFTGRDKPWLVHVDVYLKSDADPRNPEFSVASYLPEEVHGDEKYLIFKNNCRPGFEILFQLHDLTNKGYTFPKRDADAVWSKTGDDCPGEDWAQNEVFEAPKVIERDPTILRVRFQNGPGSSGNGIGRFRYTLNVTTTGDEPYLHLDPGGTGSNGPTSAR